MSEALKLWFFRDLTDDQRLKLFGLFGLPVGEIGKVYGRQSIAARHIGDKLVQLVWNEANVFAAEPTQQDVADKTHPRFIAGYTAGLNDARLEAGDTPPPQTHSEVATRSAHAHCCKLHFLSEGIFLAAFRRPSSACFFRSSRAVSAESGFVRASSLVGSCFSAIIKASVGVEKRTCQKLNGSPVTLPAAPQTKKKGLPKQTLPQWEADSSWAMELPTSALKQGSEKSVPLPPENHPLGLEGIKPAHPDVNALRRLVVEIRAGSPAFSEGGRLLPFLEYLLSLLVRHNHAAELESAARVPTPPPANIRGDNACPVSVEKT
jgi:hypothetical protein